jgi:hypothetical protein
MKYICSFLFFTLLFILASSHQTFGQTPLKKTNLKAKDRMAWYKELQWEELYMLHPFADEADNDDAGMEFYQLSEYQYLIEIFCAPGAGNPVYLFYFYDESKPRRKRGKQIQLQKFDAEDDGSILGYFEKEIFGLPTFDRKTQTLELYSKSRGAGGCGCLVHYKFVDGKPIVIRARARSCGETKWIEPERWPVVNLKKVRWKKPEAQNFEE